MDRSQSLLPISVLKFILRVGLNITCNVTFTALPDISNEIIHPSLVKIFLLVDDSRKVNLLANV